MSGAKEWLAGSLARWLAGSLVALIGIVGLWFFRSAKPNSSAGPPLTLGPVSHSADRIITSDETTVAFKIPIVNKSKHHVEILEVDNKCNCTILALAKGVLEPNETTEVTGEARVGGKRGNAQVDVTIRYLAAKKQYEATERVFVQTRPRIEPSVRQVELAEHGERRQATVRIRQFRLASEPQFGEPVFSVRGDPLTATITGEWSEDVHERGFIFREATLSLRPLSPEGGSTLLLSAVGDDAHRGVERLPICWKAPASYLVSRRSVTIRQAEIGGETISVKSLRGPLVLAKLDVPNELAVAIKQTGSKSEELSLTISAKTFLNRPTIRTVAINVVTGQAASKEEISVLLLPNPSVARTKEKEHGKRQQ